MRRRRAQPAAGTVAWRPALVVITHRSPSAEPGDRMLVVEDGRMRPATSYEWAP
ncbi:hypothetical protein [Nonomuraea sp. B1E8]|uniref:hypothetical protein n=1 Tax=unclassified Nonomuraea TaxID=2593643 RepID=UPI00325D1B8E